MAYPEHLIHDGENVALDLNPHWWFFIQHIAVGTGILGLVAIWMSVGVSFIETGLKYIIGALLVFWAVWLGIRFLAWRNTYFVVTDRRVIFRTGFVAKRGVEIPLDRITNIDFQQGPIERMIGAGDLDIQSAGRDGSSHFEDVRHPDAVQQEIYRQIEHRDQHRADRNASAIATAIGDQAPAAAEGDPTEQLRRLAALRDEGVITAEEFEAKKADLLDRM
ncbi:MAG: PH domain-containing protein [Actinomycetes bacterium]